MLQSEVLDISKALQKIGPTFIPDELSLGPGSRKQKAPAPTPHAKLLQTLQAVGAYRQQISTSLIQVEPPIKPESEAGKALPRAEKDKNTKLRQQVEKTRQWLALAKQQIQALDDRLDGRNRSAHTVAERFKKAIASNPDHIEGMAGIMVWGDRVMHAQAKIDELTESLVKLWPPPAKVPPVIEAEEVLQAFIAVVGKLNERRARWTGHEADLQDKPEIAYRALQKRHENLVEISDPAERREIIHAIADFRQRIDGMFGPARDDAWRRTALIQDVIRIQEQLPDELQFNQAERLRIVNSILIPVMGVSDLPSGLRSRTKYSIAEADQKAAESIEGALSSEGRFVMSEDGTSLQGELEDIFDNFRRMKNLTVLAMMDCATNFRRADRARHAQGVAEARSAARALQNNLLDFVRSAQQAIDAFSDRYAPSALGSPLVRQKATQIVGSLHWQIAYFEAFAQVADCICPPVASDVFSRPVALEARPSGDEGDTPALNENFTFAADLAAAPEDDLVELTEAGQAESLALEPAASTSIQASLQEPATVSAAQAAESFKATQQVPKERPGFQQMRELVIADLDQAHEAWKNSQLAVDAQLQAITDMRSVTAYDAIVEGFEKAGKLQSKALARLDEEALKLAKEGIPNARFSELESEISAKIAQCERQAEWTRNFATGPQSRPVSKDNHQRRVRLGLLTPTLMTKRKGQGVVFEAAGAPTISILLKQSPITLWNGKLHRPKPLPFHPHLCPGSELKPLYLLRPADFIGGRIKTYFDEYQPGHDERWIELSPTECHAYLQAALRIRAERSQAFKASAKGKKTGH